VSKTVIYKRNYVSSKQVVFTRLRNQKRARQHDELLKC